MLESCPSDELPDAQPAPTARADRDALGRFVAGNGASRLGGLMRPLGPAMGHLAELEAQAPAAWRAARRAARQAATRRVQHWAQLHGGELGEIPASQVLAATVQEGDAAYLEALAAQQNKPDLLKLAAMLRTSARQTLRDAWELGSRECAARPMPPAALVLRPRPPKEESHG
jgi:hypothetical protein